MAVKMAGTYAGTLKMKLHHEPSGTAIHTAAPVDNNGDGSSFSPTDLVAAALGSCICTIIAIVAEKEGISMDGLAFECEKHMNPDPRRIGRIPVTVKMPSHLTPEQRQKLEQAGVGCPVCKSLGPDVETKVTFVYG